MIIVGLTGGIGSGKTTVAGFFKDLGIAIYIADDAGKKLMLESSAIKESIVALFGAKAYSDNTPNRKFIASKVFGDKEQLEKLNAIIHPAVEADFRKWLEKQDSPYIIYEAAILFEAGGYKKCDFTVLVTAEKELRINRLQERDQSSVEEIEARMNNQWSDERKSEMADFLIKNDDLAETKLQVERIHNEFLKAGKNC